MANYKWQIVNEEGTALTGFKTEEEARRFLPDMQLGHEWKVSAYEAENYETN